MINEVLLMASIVLLYGAVVIIYRIFDKEGIFAWMALATVLANIEVLRVVEAFGIQQTLGNVLFASTFLAAQILNENEGRRRRERQHGWASPPVLPLRCCPRAGFCTNRAEVTGQGSL